MDPVKAIGIAVALFSMVLQGSLGSGVAFADEPTAPARPPAAPATGPTPIPVPLPPTAVSPAADLLRAADAALAAGALNEAKSLYQRVIDTSPGTPPATDAWRALHILALASGAAATPATAAPVPPLRAGAAGDTVMRLDPYSLRTAERVRLTTWEKLDFGVTSFLYGMSLGFSYAGTLDHQRDEDVTTPVALGALAYTLGAVTFLKLTDPDRGDLPLALAITSYVPTTTLLLSTYLFPDARSQNYAWATTIAALAAVPVAVYATKKLTLDPGDTQLVRDAGFWGLVLGTAGALGFGSDTIETYYGGSYQKEPGARTVAAWAGLGLLGGLGLGTLAAAYTEVSLERVRVTTWGGYGGALLGGLLAAGGHAREDEAYKAIAMGSAVGLAITFLATYGLDGIPPETNMVSQLLPHGVSPTLLATPALEPGATPTVAYGFAGAWR
jgi:hypothetical protein